LFKTFGHTEFFGIFVFRNVIKPGLGLEPSFFARKLNAKNGTVCLPIAIHRAYGQLQRAVEIFGFYGKIALKAKIFLRFGIRIKNK
jgi:hypothetical protein